MPFRSASVDLAAALLAMLSCTPVGAENVVPNPDFDSTDIGGWSCPLCQSLQWSENDEICSPPNPSGSLALDTLDGDQFDTFASRCVGAPSSSPVYMTARANFESCSWQATVRAAFFSSGDCSGAPISSQTRGALNCGAWETYGDSGIVVPPGTTSILLGVGLVHDINSAPTVGRFDHIYFGPEAPVMQSGFEGGGYCRWTVSP